uniref:ATP synthase F0 subunit 8 n=1 Tax=Elaphe bimaculata TaxID=74363 RepID=A0A3G0ZFZ7_9SAUR|nr:ATP synthase F0 subunit 8 [Elaphe bimaculata]AIJ02055.1 ATP synthase F0 subunit 8 [Elaphe bimaculata]
MPQLDTIYILTTHLWTWTMLHLMAQKIKTFTMTTNPVTYLTPKPTNTLQWL